MVFDQCKDEICESGFLDFDIYNKKQPVSFGNISGIKWRGVECPVQEDKLEYLICSQNTSNFTEKKEKKFFFYIERINKNINNINVIFFIINQHTIIRYFIDFMFIWYYCIIVINFP